jgi:hypothetical protein
MVHLIDYGLYVWIVGFFVLIYGVIYAIRAFIKIEDKFK